MARKRKPPRLFLRKRGLSTSWYIRHGSTMLATGCAEADLETARGLLSEYATALDEQPSNVIEYPQPFRQDGFVYFITCDCDDFPVKIGWAVNAEARMRDLQGGLPYKVLLLGKMAGTFDDERQLHIRFALSRLEGEWFERTPELMALADRLGRPTQPQIRETPFPEDVDGRLRWDEANLSRPTGARQSKAYREAVKREIDALESERVIGGHQK